MCLDINQHSIIDKHLAKKVTDLTKYTGSTFNKIISKEFPEDGPDHHASEHNLTMLPSFHISLGKPPMGFDKEELSYWVNDNIKRITYKHIAPVIGDITLAPIIISEKDNKKSAWVPLHPYWLDQILLTNELNLDDFNSWDERLEEKNVHDKIINQCTFKHLHVSVANLTGNPHDSIARPEDCIIDTITA